VEMEVTSKPRNKMSKLDALRLLNKFIKENNLAIGDKLPPESELAELTGCSRLTLREALGVYREAGVIYSAQGKGTFICGDITQIFNTLNNNLGLTEMIIAAGYEPGVSHFEKELIKASSTVAGHLNIREGIDIIICKRLRTADGKPIVYTIDYFPPFLVPVFLERNDENMSFYELIENDAHLKIGNGRTEIFPLNCPEELAEKFHCSEGWPLLGFKHVTSDAKGTPILYSEEYFLAESFNFFINRRRMRS